MFSHRLYLHPPTPVKRDEVKKRVKLSSLPSFRLRKRRSRRSTASSSRHRWGRRISKVYSLCSIQKWISRYGVNPPKFYFINFGGRLPTVFQKFKTLFKGETYFWFTVISRTCPAECGTPILSDRLDNKLLFQSLSPG